jgi:hypothetical protein
MSRKAFKYRGCTVEPTVRKSSILVGCNNSVNRYLSNVWNVLFPDNTWATVGTKLQARQYVDRVGHSHGVFEAK